MLSSMIPLDIDSTVPLPPPGFRISPDLEAAVSAAIQTLEVLERAGISIPEPTEEQKDAARDVFIKGTSTAALSLPPSSVAHLRALLTEYDHDVISSAAQLRTYVINRLLEESSSSDARIRMKALELLGRVSDVGLFTDKTEVTYKHAPSPELEAKLKEKLERLINRNSNVVDAPFKEIIIDPVKDLGLG